MFSRFIILCLHTKEHNYQLQDHQLNSFFHQILLNFLESPILVPKLLVREILGMPSSLILLLSLITLLAFILLKFVSDQLNFYELKASFK